MNTVWCFVCVVFGNNNTIKQDYHMFSEIRSDKVEDIVDCFSLVPHNLYFILNYFSSIS